MARKKAAKLVKSRAGGITNQKIEPGERPDDHGHNETERNEHVISPFRFIVPAHDLQGHSDRVSLAGSGRSTGGGVSRAKTSAHRRGSHKALGASG